jgi:hypothetical protein
VFQEACYIAGSGWHGPVSLGGGAAISGSPAAVYDQVSGGMEVYATIGSSLSEIFWHRGCGWSAWQSLGSAFTAR